MYQSILYIPKKEKERTIIHHTFYHKMIQIFKTQVNFFHKKKETRRESIQKDFTVSRRWKGKTIPKCLQESLSLFQPRLEGQMPVSEGHVPRHPGELKRSFKMSTGKANLGCVALTKLDLVPFYLPTKGRMNNRVSCVPSARARNRTPARGLAASNAHLYTSKALGNSYIYTDMYTNICVLYQ